MLEDLLWYLLAAGAIIGILMGRGIEEYVHRKQEKEMWRHNK